MLTIGVVSIFVVLSSCLAGLGLLVFMFYLCFLRNLECGAPTRLRLCLWDRTVYTSCLYLSCRPTHAWGLDLTVTMTLTMTHTMTLTMMLTHDVDRYRDPDRDDLRRGVDQ